MISWWRRNLRTQRQNKAEKKEGEKKEQDEVSGENLNEEKMSLTWQNESLSQDGYGHK